MIDSELETIKTFSLLITDWALAQKAVVVILIQGLHHYGRKRFAMQLFYELHTSLFHFIYLILDP